MNNMHHQMDSDKFGIQTINMLPGVTSLELMPRLGSHIGLNKLYIKRDDEGGRGGGGNKIRKFQRQFAKLISNGHDTVIMTAHHQSNAARELVGVAAQMGLSTVIVVKDVIGRKTDSFAQNGNRLLLDLLDAKLVEIPAGTDAADFVENVSLQLKASGANPFIIPFGASDPLGSMGYVDCANEILDQIHLCEGRAPDIVVVPTGSCGTHAGLAAGFAKQDVSTKTIGFTILKQKDDAVVGVETLANQILRELGEENLNFDVNVDDCALGGGYGEITPECLEAIRLTARLEGLFLDPVYTGKAMAGLISQVKRGLIDPDQIVVFVHTGGLPLLFAYSDAFEIEA